MFLQFCGASKMVTGSCFFLDTGVHKVLVDCGMFQGRDASAHNQDQFPFDPGQIDYVFLTHAHIDHCGRLPVLLKHGFHGKIIATRATRDLVRILLEDSAQIQKDDAERCHRRGELDCELAQLYTPEEALDVMQYFETYPYGDSIRLSDNLEFRMRDAGHILGSAFFELWAKDSDGTHRKIVFSGDIGQPGQRIVKDPDLVREADYVVVESTYGNRLHRSKDETLLELLSILTNAKREGGNVLIPTFAVERAQEIIYEMNLFAENHLVPDGLEVYFDSPLGIKATEIFERHSELFDEDARRLLEGGDHVFQFDGLRYIDKFRDSRRLAARHGIVILAGSGMCTGGRIVYHLENNVDNPKNHLVFAGYQVKGTKGRDIVDGARTIRLSGRQYPLNLQVHTLGGFSAHGDRGDLEYWLRGFGTSPRKIFVVHGDPDVAVEFSERIRDELKRETYVPDLYDRVELE
ncbi:MAG: MBL fold metallo-hydrolase [Candidatus Dojkabacteria bacterium]|nr:MBL fold metallo-hydrolase [Candidatus Dojkabacteria bacterium]